MSKYAFTAVCFILAILLFQLVTWMTVPSEPKILRRTSAEDEVTYKREPFIPPNGTFYLKVNPIANLSGLSKEEFIKFRTAKVKEYEFLHIFPANYNILSPPSDGIYERIEFNKGWLQDTQYYVCNPYLLIVISRVIFVNAVTLGCRFPEVVYRDGTIEEIYRGEDAKIIFARLHTSSEPGVVKVWLVNAYDAGFRYITLDNEKSRNIDFDWNQEPENIGNAVYSVREFYHVGKYGVNNISPGSRRGRFKLQRNNTYTCMYFKLWTEKPVNPTQPASLAYVIKLIP